MQIIGNIDRCDGRVIEGWVCIEGNPDEKIRLDVFLARVHLGRCKADRPRADLQAKGIGGGACAFSFELPYELARDELDKVEVRLAGSSLLLPNRLIDGSRPAPARRPARSHPFPAGVGDESQFPVFILGAPRSGTSAIAAALRAGTRYEGYAEGHLFPLLGDLASTIGRYFVRYGEASLQATMMSTVTEELFLAEIAELFQRLAKTRSTGPFWYDKTPNNAMIALTGDFKALWPNAKFIFMRRRGIENLASRRRKFPEGTFADHCHDWADSLQLWAAVRNTLSGQALEVDQLTLAKHPELVADAVGKLLALDEVEKARLSACLLETRLEQTGDSPAATTSLSEVDWPEAEKETFRRVCGEAMTLYGYEYSRAYFTSDGVQLGIRQV